MQANQLTTFTRGDLMISSPDEAVVLRLATLAIGVSSTMAAHTAVPAIGTYWEGEGGVYAGVMRGEEGQPDYHLIVPTDAAVLNHKAEYGGRGIEEPGAVSRFDGLANTLALVESETDHPAAQWCHGLVVEGHNDLYLPSILEQALIAANLPDLFVKEWHLSSSQRSAYSAFTMHFDDGNQSYGGKSNELLVRPVRRLPI